MPEMLRQVIARNRAGHRTAIPSVCTAHPDALRASLALASRLGREVVVEATSNQVNQDGGYTGITPDQFIGYVYGIADEVGADRALIQFGGDHLGPQAWRALPAEAAMEKARVLVADYVRAGFRKIHLDCSEGCANEPAQLADAVTAERSADLAQVCAGLAEDLLFVVGTEVPPPGGARVDEDGDIPATDPTAARATVQAHDDAFGPLAPLIGGLVVQPGVEFSPTAVHALPLQRDPHLLDALSDHPHICLEAHSTDYQDPAVFPRLAELGFAFQKVGPALTFAYREALYALDKLRDPAGQVMDKMEKVMLANPSWWQGHYSGDAAALRDQRHYGLADRIRYYWPDAEAQKAVRALQEDLAQPLPDAALRQVFEPQVLDRVDSLSGTQVQRLIQAQIECALDPYFFKEVA